ncbi:3-oxoacyl-ACP reductase [Brevibacterium jeotgali]|uniref:3-oxoacyl-[acyl-carrier protein] reductase n=1 Tax=Brevibacterium jeotgali TaxID=1262550 RepID=A0A2H1L264_9MICO|nr:3-oxoacyl-ACP reductase [Brevibacterium jeotgali]TWC02858.1 3-oxoacyl-[acyl-carrier protein] reductase [Brevibacterium jeotgali]SMY10880.1 3-oxoacyl-[acyl-carrier protein] reductase [Brevibacterium jeotgali]
MTDRYTRLANGPLKALVKTLGLPSPVPLRRYRDGAYLSEPVLVLGAGAAADAYAQILLDNGFEVRRKPTSEKLSAVLAFFDEAQTPTDLSETALEIGGALRGLVRCSRVVVFSRDAHIAPERPADVDPALNAARSGTLGLMRSLAHEMRGGSTANGIVVSDGVPMDAPSVQGALWFLLSSKSAYVSGQPLHVTTADGEATTAEALAGTHLDGRVAVVTGAARGIGAAIAATLARDGASVVGVDVPQAGDALARTMNEVGGTALQLDITAEDAGRVIAQRVGAPIDIFVHNAGITRDRMLANMESSRWDSVIAVNIDAQLRINAQLTEAGAWGSSPRVVSLASTSGIAGNRGQTNYSASKAGVIGMAAAAADSFAAQGGTINAVAPGFIETEMTATMPTLTREVARRIASLQQGGLPDDVAEAIAFLAAGSSGGISGTTLRVCGQNMVGA